MRLDTIIIGDMNMDVLGNCSNGHILIDFCSTFNLTQLVKEPTRITEASETLIDIALTTNDNIIDVCKVKTSSISDHNLISLTLKFKAPKPRTSYITTRNYKRYDPEKFVKDLANVPFHIIDIFDDFNDQMDVFNTLFSEVLDDHAPVKTTKIKARPNPYITPEIRQLMKTRDKWHKSAIKTKDNAYRFFRQEVKREIRIEEKQQIRTELKNSRGNTNSIWKV